MARRYTAFDIVALPRTDAHGTIALAKAIESAAAAESGLPDNLTSALGAIAARRDVLQKAKGMSATTKSIREVDDAEDDCACALYALLQAWARLAPYIPEGKTAQALLDRLFGDGVGFVNFKVEQEWAVVDSMLKAIETENLAPALEGLGAGPMLVNLKKVHAEYGDVIGTTKPEPDPVEVGEKRDALLSAIRLYVVRVAGIVEPGDESTEAKANALLRPIAEWRTEKRSTKEKAGNAPPGNPAPGGPAGDKGPAPGTGDS